MSGDDSMVQVVQTVQIVQAVQPFDKLRVSGQEEAQDERENRPCMVSLSNHPPRLNPLIDLNVLNFGFENARKT
jgi:hypothetical protein